MKRQHYIFINNPEGKGKRVMFVGGDITVTPEETGYLASDIQKDYVHRCRAFANVVVPDSAFCSVMSREWETNYHKSEDVLSLYDDCKKFKPDVIVFQLGDHIDEYTYDSHLFKREFKKFLYHIDPFRRANILIMTSFSCNMADTDLQIIAKQQNAPCIYLGDYCQLKDMYIEIDGKRYPNDQCMDNIAKAVLCIIENYLRK